LHPNQEFVKKEKDLLLDLFCMATTNWTGSQFVALEAKLKYMNEMVENLKSSRYDESRFWGLVQEIGLRGDFSKAASSFLFYDFEIRTDLCRYLVDSGVDAFKCGRFFFHGVSGLFGFERGDGSGQVEYFRAKNNRQEIFQHVRSCIWSLRAEYVFVLDSKFREEHSEDSLRKSLMEILEICRYSKGKSMIIVEMDELIGLVEDTFTFQVTSTDTKGTRRVNEFFFC